MAYLILEYIAGGGFTASLVGVAVVSFPVSLLRSLFRHER